MTSQRAVMLQRQRMGQLRQMRSVPKARIRSLQSPIGGLNTLNSIDDMPKEDAIKLDNFFPDLGSVKLRRGSADHATGLGSGNVDALFEYNSGNTRKLLAGANGNIYDATSAGSASSLGSGFTSNQWDAFNFDGSQLWFNGQNTPQIFDGSTLSANTFTGTGLTATDLIGGMVFKNRIFLRERNSPDFWYGGLNAKSGALTRFPLSRVGNTGGDLIAMGTWTVDAGNGIDDLAVFLMSSGEAIVYAGTDPGDASAWALTGVYNVGRVLGSRALAKVGADLVIMTVDDIVPMTSLIRRGRFRSQRDLTKISGGIREMARLYSGNFGWSGLVYPKGTRTIFNIPIASTTLHQFVVNNLTGSWCRFVGMNGRSWSLFDDDLYFGGVDGKVKKADEGTQDSGVNIVADARQAFWNLGVEGRKVVHASRFLFRADDDLTVNRALSFDFEDVPLSQQTSTATSGATWDEAEWDDAEWAGGETVTKTWGASGGTGYWVSPRLRFATNQLDVAWLGTQYRFSAGNVV